MKHKFSRILGVGLSLMLLMSLLAFAAPVSAGTLKWTTEVIPSTTGKVLELGSDILDFAVYGDGETIYATTDFATDLELSHADNLTTSGGSATAAMSIEQAHSGAYSAKLHAGFTGSDWAEVTLIPTVTITLDDMASIGGLGWWYYIATADFGLKGTALELYFESATDADGWAEMTIMDKAYGTVAHGGPPTFDAWTEQLVDSTTTGCVFGVEEDTTAIAQYPIPAAGEGTVAAMVAHLKTLDTNAGNWVLTQVRPTLGWIGAQQTIAYIDDVTINGVVYKSTDTGASWSGLTNPTGAFVPKLVAVAPDDADIVAIVADVNEVYVTTDGGTTWGDITGVLGLALIRDIDISAASAGINYIAAAGDAEVWTYNIGSASPAWKEISAGTYPGFETATTVAALTYSPNFPSDQVLAVVTYAENVTATTDYVKLQLWSENQDQWNATAGFDSYPATIVDDDGITGLGAASISLDPEYLGSDDAMRMAFVGLSVLGDSDAQAESGIHRMDDTTYKALKTGATVDIHSIAFDGANLVAGRHGTNTAVWRCADPLATSPSVKGASSLKRPGGTNSVVVAWVGTDVVAGTSGDESAFAVSINDGKSFNDISLIDTTLTNMTDVAVSPDGSVVYMATDDGADLSLWRSAASWQRVLSGQDKAGFIIRLAPDDPDVLYIADKATTSIYYTADGGTERWQQRTSRYSIQDLAVETDGDVAYVLIADDGKVSKSSNAGFTWGSSKSSKLNGGNMIVSLGEDELLAASDDGYVAYSTDGGSSFTKIGKQLGDTGSAVTTIASGVSDGDYVYAGLGTASKNVYRWQIGTSTSWSDIYEDTVNPVHGMVLFENALYVSAAVGGISENATNILRTLDPTDAVSVSWSTANKTDVAFDTAPQGLRVTAGSAKMWAVDSVNDVLYGYTDTVALLGPELVGPAQGFVDKINPISGYANDMAFTWTKPSARVTAYDLWIAVDTGFKEVAKKISVSSTSSTVGQVVGHTADASLDFMPGDVYFWKVRVSSPLYSPWSLYRSFTVEEAVAPVTTVTVEPAPAPEIIVTPAPPPQVTVTVPPAPTPITPAPAIPAYLLWAIICIGAVLMIALIVLIVRTRRVV